MRWRFLPFQVRLKFHAFRKWDEYSVESQDDARHTSCPLAKLLISAGKCLGGNLIFRQKRFLCIQQRSVRRNYFEICRMYNTVFCVSTNRRTIKSPENCDQIFQYCYSHEIKKIFSFKYETVSILTNSYMAFNGTQVLLHYILRGTLTAFLINFDCKNVIRSSHSIAYSFSHYIR